MKMISVIALFAGLSAAHSAVWNITFDGNLYPARDGRMDDELNATRIEWWRGEVQKGNPWASVNDVKSDAITCGLHAKPPRIHAVARAGSQITVQWSGMIRMHNGPVMSYLGYLPTPETKPQEVTFFKINDGGYDKLKQKWVNEEILDNGRRESFPIPSDIKPGMYIFRTDLVALHGNAMGDGLPKKGTGAGPQFYTHCFNVKITGDGTVSPEGVKFPGGYKREDSGLTFSLRNKAKFNDYVIPGPSKYAGKYDPPAGTPPVLSKVERGFFPEPFQSSYEQFKREQDIYAETSTNSFNGVGSTSFAQNMLSRGQIQQKLKADQEALRQEAIKLGITSDAVKAAIPPFDPTGLYVDP